MIAKAQLSVVRRGLLVAEASDLGWKPGEWPDTIEVEALGECRRVSLDASGAIYQSTTDAHVVVKIFND